MAISSDIDGVLAQWGDGEPGPMNGASGQGLSDKIVGIFERLAPAPLRVCDLGCGNGYLASRLGGMGHQVVGVDASTKLLRVATQHYQSERVRFRQGLFSPELAEELSADPFDVVVSADVIEHLYRPMTLIETAHRILKPGGRFFVCTPYHGYLKNVAISVLGQWDWHHTVDWDGGHVKFFSCATLSKMVGRHFAVNGFEFYGRAPWLWKNMILLATKPRA